MRLLAAVALTIAAAVPLAAQSTSTPAHSGQTMLDQQRPHQDSGNASSKLLATAPQELQLTAPQSLKPTKIVIRRPLVAKNSTCFAVRGYGFTPGADAVAPSGYSTCVPARSGRALGAAHSLTLEAKPTP